MNSLTHVRTGSRSDTVALLNEPDSCSRVLLAGGTDLVIMGTPIDLGRVTNIPQPRQRAHYKLQEIGRPMQEGILDEMLKPVSN